LPHHDELVRVVAASSPFKRIGTPGEVASVITFLVSDDARWVTGQTICVNGGAKL
jgi:NAD(P)-dependent dehydrogenase (short-subunit alcohol dehydrogenase family)